MSKDEFIEKYGNGDPAFIADLNSLLARVDDGYDPDEDDFDDYDYDEQDREDQEWEEQCERAYSCKCGAYQMNSKGNPVHIADCICGAD